MDKKLLDLLATARKENREDSCECARQNDKCLCLYEELSASLDEKQLKLLLSLERESLILEGITNNESFREGTENGFKQAIRLVFDCMK